MCLYWIHLISLGRLVGSDTHSKKQRIYEGRGKILFFVQMKKEHLAWTIPVCGFTLRL